MAIRSIAPDEVIASPYPHVATANTLVDYEALRRAFPAEDRFGPQIRMHGDLTWPDPEYVKLIDEEPAYRKLHDWVYSEGFVRTFVDIFDAEIDRYVKNGDLIRDPRTLPIRPEPYERRDDLIKVGNTREEAFLFPRLDIGIGRLNYGIKTGGNGIHVDNLTRLVSVLIYIDDNPDMVGGEHRLYGLDGYTPVIDKIYPAKGDFMVASLQSNRAFHDVNPVSAITGVRKAMYLAVSCSAEIWRPDTDDRLAKLTKSRYRPSAAERALRSVRDVVKSAVGR
ncbi:MAG: 2OG-Fe(II) oxygenase [Sphingomonadaceae bacterium]|nr:2OG-Fe(II) oxygenase [Sphingomonadaceae bacterium]